jgi:hypothetical protein
MLLTLTCSKALVHWLYWGHKRKPMDGPRTTPAALNRLSTVVFSSSYRGPLSTSPKRGFLSKLSVPTFTWTEWLNDWNRTQGSALEGKCSLSRKTWESWSMGLFFSRPLYSYNNAISRIRVRFEKLIVPKLLKILKTNHKLHTNEMHHIITSYSLTPHICFNLYKAIFRGLIIYIYFASIFCVCCYVI